MKVIAKTRTITAVVYNSKTGLTEHKSYKTSNLRASAKTAVRQVLDTDEVLVLVESVAVDKGSYEINDDVFFTNATRIEEEASENV